MNIKDSAGIIIIVLAIVTLYGALAFQSRGEFSQTTLQIGDLRERITRVEVVMDERLPRSRVIASQPPSERSTEQPAR